MIDQYIGEFGNLIDVWRTHVNDFTGYKTRYESSSHMCKSTGMSSEVVGYDGAFYPPALEQYLSSSSHSLADVSAFYSHLGILDNAVSSEVDSMLQSSCSSIAQIAQLYDEGSEYDIFKYAYDLHGNIYVLYKKYSQPDLPWNDKLHTPGQLWIRLADTPIAFPMGKVIG